MAKRELSNGNIVDIPQAEWDQQVADSQAAIKKNIRINKISEIKEELLVRVNAVLPGIDTFEEIDMLKKLYAAFTPSVKGESAKDIYVYAVTKINQAKTAPIAQVEAYDPTTDPNWPD